MENSEKQRFLNVSEDEIKNLVAEATPKSTKKSTKYAVNVFSGKTKFVTIGLCLHL